MELPCRRALHHAQGAVNFALDGPHKVRDLRAAAAVALPLNGGTANRRYDVGAGVNANAAPLMQ
jgi:hypothetical protein